MLPPLTPPSRIRVITTSVEESSSPIFPVDVLCSYSTIEKKYSESNDYINTINNNIYKDPKQEIIMSSSREYNVEEDAEEEEEEEEGTTEDEEEMEYSLAAPSQTKTFQYPAISPFVSPRIIENSMTITNNNYSYSSSSSYHRPYRSYSPSPVIRSPPTPSIIISPPPSKLQQKQVNATISEIERLKNNDNYDNNDNIEESFHSQMIAKEQQKREQEETTTTNKISKKSVTESSTSSESTAGNSFTMAQKQEKDNFVFPEKNQQQQQQVEVRQSALNEQQELVQTQDFWAGNILSAESTSDRIHSQVHQIAQQEKKI